MEIGREHTSRSVSFVFVAVGLAAIATGLGAMLLVTLEAVQNFADPVAQKLLARLAWLSLFLLCLTLVLLIWVVLRQIRYHLRSSPPLKPSHYVNAWELAGKRFKLEDEGQDADEDDDGEEGSDRQGD